MPYICMVRTDIPDATLQILDLDPNESQRNLIIDPPGQTKYVNRLTNDTVATSGAGPITTNGAYTGLAAYLIDRVEDTDNADAALTAAMANAAALAIIAQMDAGGVLDQATVDALIQAETGGATASLTGGDSTGSLADVLKILAGAPYLLPAGSQVEDGANDFDASISGSFTAPSIRHTYDSGALTISLAEGELATYTASTFVYGSTSGAAVAVYNDDGSLLS
jgi:hypothetical protein